MQALVRPVATLSAPCRPCRPCKRRCAAVVQQHSQPQQQKEPAALVDAVLELVDGTDGGANIGMERRQQADALLDELEAIGAQQDPRPLQSPLLWGHWNVLYTSTSRSRDRGSPSGGRFRSGLGRALFRTTGLFQSAIPPNIVTNKVAFKLFGLFAGAVSLRGVLEPVGTTNDTVKVLFEPTVLSFGDDLHLKIGSTSEVQLTTTYLDERVRVGKGSRGSLFLFSRGGPADAAGMDAVGRQASTQQAIQLLAATAVAALLGGLALWLSGVRALQFCAPLLLLLGAGVGSLLRTPGRIITAATFAAGQQQQQGQGQPEAVAP